MQPTTTPSSVSRVPVVPVLASQPAESSPVAPAIDGFDRAPSAPGSSVTAVAPGLANSMKRGLASLIHPAASLYDAAEAGEMLALYGPYTRPLRLRADDGVRLDGCIVSVPAEGQVGPRPLLVMALGNAMYYEACLPMACVLSESCDIDILLYNGRGVGRSGGVEQGTADAVRDCRAAIRYATVRCPQVGVYGFSLGGGISALALAALAVDAPEALQRLSLYLNVNSFSSLHQCVGGVFAGLLGGYAAGLSAFAGLARGTFWLTGFDPLDAHTAIASTHLADEVVVMCAEEDEVMRPGSRLADSLAGVAAPANTVRVIRTSGRHNDVELTGLAEVLGAWRQRLSEPG